MRGSTGYTSGQVTGLTSQASLSTIGRLIQVPYNAICLVVGRAAKERLQYKHETPASECRNTLACAACWCEFTYRSPRIEKRRQDLSP